MSDPDSPLDALLSELGEGATADRGQSLTVDHALAREKLSQYQLAEPLHYVLALVQVAVLKGATSIRFRLDGNDVFMSFDGRPLTREDLQDWVGALFHDGDDPEIEARRELAVAINATRALRARSFFLRSGDADRGVRFELTGGEHKKLETEPQETTGTHIHVRTRFGRLRRMLDLFRLGSRTGAVLHRGCRYAALPIWVNKFQVSKGLELEGVGVVDLASDNVRGIAGFVLAPYPPREVRLCKNGVWFTSVTLPDAPPNFRAVVEADRLRKDLSQAEVVEDDALAGVLNHVTEAIPRALERLCFDVDGDRIPIGSHREIAKKMLCDELLRYDARALVEGSAADPTGALLASVDLWEMRVGDMQRSEWWSLHSLMAFRDEGGRVRVQLNEPGPGHSIFMQKVSKGDHTVVVATTVALHASYLEQMVNGPADGGGAQG